jgi:broad specificity phosphatase PhoE
VSVIYLVRHGQAGTRENYDALSDLGREQAGLLSEYFETQGLQFDAVYSGSLARQRATAALACPRADVMVDPAWNEFDLDRVYREMAPALMLSDDDFRREFELMRQALAASQGAHDAPVHRSWNDCDKKLVRAWVDGRHEYSGESWKAFTTRIHAALARVVAAKHPRNAVVFTSATPAGICAARTLELQDRRAMWLAGVLFNASFSTLHVREEEVRLFSFNNTPHLNAASLRTFR